MHTYFNLQIQIKKLKFCKSVAKEIKFVLKITHYLRCREVFCKENVLPDTFSWYDIYDSTPK